MSPPPRSALDSRVENLGVLRFRWVAVGVDDEVVICVVRRLERRSRLDVDQSTRRYVVPLRWLADVHRQRTREDDERLFLGEVAMAAPESSWFVPPNVCPGVQEAGKVAQFGNVPRRLATPVRARNPPESVRVN